MTDQTNRLEKSAIALLLTFAAGCVDIVGYLSIYHTFTAHMTGITVHLGNSLFDRNRMEAIVALIVLVSFISGSLGGRVLIEMGARKRIRSIASWTLGIEALLLTIVASQMLGGLVVGAGPHYPRISLAMLAIAMGLQTATITRVGGLTVHTTFVTGMINKLSQLLSHALFESYDVATASSDSIREHRRHRGKAVRNAAFIFLIWCFYTSGAIAGTWLQSKWHLHGLYVPVALLCLAIGADQILPLSVEEEKDQSER